jgi:1,4-alpha-glucan branching enzyme
VHSTGDSSHAKTATRMTATPGIRNTDGILTRRSEVFPSRSGTSRTFSQLAGSLARTGDSRIAYHESHDEAGNSDLTLRTIRVAVNDAVLFEPTRDTAEARARLAAGISMLSAGTPMFLMGEEVGAKEPFNTTRSCRAGKTSWPNAMSLERTSSATTRT